jgi:hypothetical protein
LNRGWRFCRPLPYHLATAPVGIELCEGIPAASVRRGNNDYERKASASLSETD